MTLSLNSQFIDSGEGGEVDTLPSEGAAVEEGGRGVEVESKRRKKRGRDE